IRVAAPCAVKRKRWPPLRNLMLGTSRTRLFFSNSRSSWGTLPNPLISSSNRVPSPISPGDSLRALGVVGFHLGKFATLTTVSNTCSTGLSMTWMRLIIAMRFPWRCANGPRSFGEHGGEGPRIEDGANLGNLLALDLIPFANKCGPGRCLGHHVVQCAYIVAIGENLFHIDPLNDGMQFFQGLEIWLGAIKSVNGALERQIVVHEFPGSDKIPFAQRLLTVAHYLACISHRYPP